MASVVKVFLQDTSKMFRIATFPPKAPITPSVPYSRVRDLLYANFILILLKNEEVEKLGCNLKGRWGQFSRDTNLSKQMISSK